MNFEQLVEQRIKEWEDAGLKFEKDFSQADVEDAIRAEGYIENNGSSWPFVMKDVPELRFVSSKGNSNFKAYNVAIKKNKLKLEPFEEDTFYYGPNVVKDKEGVIDFDKSTTGIPLGVDFEILVSGFAYYGERSGYGKPKDTEFPAVASCFADNMFEEGQRSMIDKNSGRTIKELRDELFKKYDRKKLPDGSNIALKLYVYGYIKIEGEWKPFWFKDKTNFSQEERLTTVITTALEKGITLGNTPINVIVEYGNDSSVYRNGKFSEDLPDDERKFLIPQHIKLRRSFKELCEAQQEYLKGVKKPDTKPSESSEEDDDEDTLPW